jgi:hypothetical protein
MTTTTESSVHDLVLQLRAMVVQRDSMLEKFTKENAALRRELASRSTTALVRKPNP